LQKSPSSHGAVLFGCVQAPLPLHWSFVHTLPSLVHAVPAESKQLSAASLQLWAHSGPPAQGLPAWTVQLPPPHVSGPLQKRPSPRGAALWGCVRAPVVLLWSFVPSSPAVVQAVPAAAKQLSAASLQVAAHSGPPARGLPACVQVPPLQVSVPLQKSPSS